MNYISARYPAGAAGARCAGKLQALTGRLCNYLVNPYSSTRGSDNTEWFHREINKVLDTKGRRTLSPSGKPLDYLSINISQTAVGDICLDNKIRIADTLKKMGLNQCNPVKEPITKPILHVVPSVH